MEEKKIRTDGIILDIDGTLWDTTEIVSVAWNRAAKEGGSNRKDPISADILKTQFGKPMDEIADNIFSGDSEEKRKTLLELCIRFENGELESNPCRVAFNGVTDSIKMLSTEIPFFIVSNCQKGYIDLFCRKTGLEGCIKDQECFGNTGRGKGENIALLVKRNALKAPVYIGDTDGDRIACDEAGVPFVFASYGFGEVKREHCLAVLEKFGDIADLFRN